MKPTSFIYLFILLISCENKTSRNESNRSKSCLTNNTDTAIHKEQTSPLEKVAAKNYTDDRGRKQGVWDLKENGKIIGFETYLDGKLNGPYTHGILSGQYKNNLKEGIWKWQESKNRLAMVVYFEAGIKIWMGFPLADSDYAQPMKGFGIHADSVFVICPHANNAVWYKGLFLHEKPVGIHQMFHPDGRIKFEHDYQTGITKVFDKKGDFTEKEGP